MLSSKQLSPHSLTLHMSWNKAVAPPSGALIVSYDSKSRKDEAQLVRKQRCRRLYLPDLVLSFKLRAAIYCHSSLMSANQTTEGHTNTHTQTLTYTQRHATVDLQTPALGTQHTNDRCVLSLCAGSSLQEGLWQSLFSTSEIYTLSYAKLQFTVKHGRMESVCNKAISGGTAQISFYSLLQRSVDSDEVFAAARNNSTASRPWKYNNILPEM